MVRVVALCVIEGFSTNVLLDRKMRMTPQKTFWFQFGASGFSCCHRRLLRLNVARDSGRGTETMTWIDLAPNQNDKRENDVDDATRDDENGQNGERRHHRSPVKDTPVQRD